MARVRVLAFAGVPRVFERRCYQDLGDFDGFFEDFWALNPKSL